MLNFSKIASSASLCAVLLLTSATSAASVVNYDFSGVIDSGLLASSSYTGSFAFDNATLTDFGAISIDLSAFSLHFLSTDYGLANADFTPTADFQNGTFLGLSYSVTGTEPSFSLISALGSGLANDAAYFAYETASGDAGFGSLNFPAISSVPLPTGFWLFSSALGLLGLSKQRKK